MSFNQFISYLMRVWCREGTVLRLFRRREAGACMTFVRRPKAIARGILQARSELTPEVQAITSKIRALSISRDKYLALSQFM
jgi:hypothetical protein